VQKPAHRRRIVTSPEKGEIVHRFVYRRRPQIGADIGVRVSPNRAAASTSATPARFSPPANLWWTSVEVGGPYPRPHVLDLSHEL
jgi:hypothetical protein